MMGWKNLYRQVVLENGVFRYSYHGLGYAKLSGFFLNLTSGERKLNSNQNISTTKT